MRKVLDNEGATEETSEEPTLDDLARAGTRRMLMKAVAVAQPMDL